MIITVLFTHESTEFLEGSAKPRKVASEGRLSVGIGEITSADAPVVIKVHADGELPEYDYRWFQGRLWAPIRLADARPVSFTAGQKDWHFAPIESVLDARSAASADALNKHQFYVRYGALEDMEEGIKDWAWNTLLIDGVVYRPAREPRLVVWTFGEGENEGGTRLMLTDYTSPTQPADRYFSITQLDEALNAMKRVATERGDTESLSVKPDLPKFAVISPGLLKCWNLSAGDVTKKPALDSAAKAAVRALLGNPTPQALVDEVAGAMSATLGETEALKKAATDAIEVVIEHLARQLPKHEKR